MNTAIAAPLARAQKLAEVASTVAVVAASVLVITAAVNVGAPALRALPGLEPGWSGAHALIQLVGAQLILALPSFILAGACLDLGRVLNEYAGGRFFTTRASANVRKAGEGILYAMAFQCFLSPTIYSVITDYGRSLTVRFETFDLGLIAIGAFVMVMGRVLEAAAALKADNEEIV